MRYWGAVAVVLGLFGDVEVSRAAVPNFLVFIADDMAWEDCGAYGHPYIRTPHIDRLAREGLRFDRAYLTCSSCSPSRTSINTGRYPHATGAGELHQPVPANQVLFAKVLKDAGYYTAAAGKWHLGPHVKNQYDLVKEGGGPGGEEYWVDVLRDRPKEKPFFFWFAATDPHRDYKPGAIETPHRPEDVIVPPIFPDTPEVREDLALYYDEISRFDEYIGKVLEELDAQGERENTLVLVLSDNGRPFPRCKTTVLEDGVHTPFIVRYPALVKPGNISLSLVSSLDIGPTFLDLAGVKGLPSFQGVSFKPVLADPHASVREYTASEHNWHDYRAFERSVSTWRYRYVKNWLPHLQGTPPADAVRSPTYRVQLELSEEAAGVPRSALEVFTQPLPDEALYDVLVDPHCFNNLARDESYAGELLKHRHMLEKWQEETGDSFPGEEHLTPDGFDRVTGERLKKSGN